MPQVEGTEKNLLVTKMFFTSIFFFGSAVGFFLFTWKQAFNTAIWCVVTEAACVAILQFNTRYMKDTLGQKLSHQGMAAIKFISGLVAVGSFGAAIAFIYLGYRGEEVIQYLPGFYPAAVAAFIASIWCAILCLDCRKFEMYLRDTPINRIT